MRAGNPILVGRDADRNDQAAFMEVLGAMSQMPEMGAVFSVADVMAYLST